MNFEDGSPDYFAALVLRQVTDLGEQVPTYDKDDFLIQLAVQHLQARHRVHARVEGFIGQAKDTGLAGWPASPFEMNTAWVRAVAIAVELLCWSRLLLLEGPWPPRNPRPCDTGCCTPGPHHQTRPQTDPANSRNWPWATELETAFHRVLAIP